MKIKIVLFIVFILLLIVNIYISFTIRESFNTIDTQKLSSSLNSQNISSNALSISNTNILPSDMNQSQSMLSGFDDAINENNQNNDDNPSLSTNLSTQMKTAGIQSEMPMGMMQTSGIQSEIQMGIIQNDIQITPTPLPTFSPSSFFNTDLLKYLSFLNNSSSSEEESREIEINKKQDDPELGILIDPRERKMLNFIQKFPLYDPSTVYYPMTLTDLSKENIKIANVNYNDLYNNIGGSAWTDPQDKK